MNMNKIFSVLFLFVSTILFSQSLGKERIDRLNKAVVRIMVNNRPSGSGFFIDNEGWIASNRHVVDKAILRDSIGAIKSILPIHAEFRNGEKVELGIMIFLLKAFDLESY